MRKSILLMGGVILVGGGLYYVSQQGMNGGGADVAIDADDIGGVVTSADGPEAGVWVIAETNDLPTKFIRSVVTDDEGRYVMPDLPDANYEIWARGYGLVDSQKIVAAPGSQIDLEPMPTSFTRFAPPSIFTASAPASLMNLPAFRTASSSLTW